MVHLEEGLGLEDAIFQISPETNDPGRVVRVGDQYIGLGRVNGDGPGPDSTGQNVMTLELATALVVEVAHEMDDVVSA